MMLTESEIINLIRMEASELGFRLWRNNIGAGKMKDGSFIRWGLGNESSAVNAVLKSADLIGIRPVLITQDMVGKIIGQFVSREVKREGWKYRNTEREKAQKAWQELIKSYGGDA